MASVRAYKTGTGGRRYEVRWREDGKARSKTLTTSADAKHFANETERRLRMGGLHADRAETFGVLADSWLERYRAGMEGKRKPREKTLEAVEISLKHLAPLRDVRVDKIGLAEVEQLVLPIATRTPTTGKNVVEHLKRILRSSAKRRQPIDLSALEAYVARVVARDGVFLTWEQVQEIESFMPEFIRRIVPIAVLTLCRQGELLGIRDTDVDFEAGTVTITGQVQKGKRVATKTGAGRRTIDLGPYMLDLIREQQGVRASNPQGLLFPTITGKVFLRDNFYGRYFKPAAIAAGAGRFEKVAGVQRYRGLTFHGLRHTGASLMIAANVDVKTISERMGHTDGGALVLRTYGHLYKGRGREAALKLEQLVSGADT